MMLDPAVLRFVWWLILGALLVGFAITDGCDLGVAAAFPFIARSDAERHLLLRSIEPTWQGTRAWFIGGAAVLVLAWPLLFPVSLANVCLAVILMLLVFILRPAAFSLRNRPGGPAWSLCWDAVLAAAGVAPALLLGIAVGNLYTGVPFRIDAGLHPVYTGDIASLLHPFALLVGLVSLALLILHGCAYIALKAVQPMDDRAAAFGSWAALGFAVTFVIAGDAAIRHMNGYFITAGPHMGVRKTVLVLHGAWLGNYQRNPALWLIPVTTLGSALGGAILLKAGQAGKAFVLTSVTQAGTLLTAGVALYPFLMPSSSEPSQSLTVWDAAGGAAILKTTMVGVAVGVLLLAWAYMIRVLRVLRGPGQLPNRSTER